jgi:hypothetical protein
LREQVRVLPVDQPLHVLLACAESLELGEDLGDLLAELGCGRGLGRLGFRDLVEELGIHRQDVRERFRLMLVQDPFATFDLSENGRAEAREVHPVGQILAALEACHPPGGSYAGTDAFHVLGVHEPHATAMF